MTPDEIIGKWIGIGLFDDEPIVTEAEASIIAGLKADIQQAIDEEREACAKIAAGYFDTQVGETIADYIREGRNDT